MKPVLELLSMPHLGMDRGPSLWQTPSPPVPPLFFNAAVAASVLKRDVSEAHLQQRAQSWKDPGLRA